MKSRAAIEREYRKAKRMKADVDDPKVCEGCGRAVMGITCSHTIPRGRRRDLIADIDNLNWDCPDCHRLREAGRWGELLNGKKTIEYVSKADPRFLSIQQMKWGNQLIKKENSALK